MLAWFRAGGVIGILDATNSTVDRRRWVLETCQAAGVEVLFVESKCDDEDLIMANIRDVKTTSPDYKGQDPEEAALDFRNRIRMYEKVYRSVDEGGDESHLTYLKIMDVGRQVIINRIEDYLQSRVVYYLMNLHIRQRSVWLSRVSCPCALASGVELRACTNRSSTARVCITWTARSAATPTSLSAASYTPGNYPSSCGNQSAYVSFPPNSSNMASNDTRTTAPSQSGPPP